MNDAPGDNKEAAVQLPQRYLLQFNNFSSFYLFIYFFSFPKSRAVKRAKQVDGII